MVNPTKWVIFGGYPNGKMLIWVCLYRQGKFEYVDHLSHKGSRWWFFLRSLGKRIEFWSRHWLYWAKQSSWEYQSLVAVVVRSHAVRQ